MVCEFATHFFYLNNLIYGQTYRNMNRYLAFSSNWPLNKSYTVKVYHVPYQFILHCTYICVYSKIRATIVWSMRDRECCRRVMMQMPSQGITIRGDIKIVVVTTATFCKQL